VGRVQGCACVTGMDEDVSGWWLGSAGVYLGVAGVMVDAGGCGKQIHTGARVEGQ
jgi:hypothetical protein